MNDLYLKFVQAIPNVSEGELGMRELFAIITDRSFIATLDKNCGAQYYLNNYYHINNPSVSKTTGSAAGSPDDNGYSAGAGYGNNSMSKGTNYTGYGVGGGGIGKGGQGGG